MLPNRTVVIEDERIKAIGTPEHPAPRPRHAHVIEGRGKFVIPGLIDAHAHLVHQLDFAHVTGDEIFRCFWRRE